MSERFANIIFGCEFDSRSKIISEGYITLRGENSIGYITRWSNGGVVASLWFPKDQKGARELLDYVRYLT